MSDNELDNSKAPLLEHLAELRKRLLVCCVGIIIAFFGFYFVSADIYNFLVHPLALATEGQVGRRMIFTGLHEAFLTQVKVAFFASICFSFPVLSVQIWRFIAPGLYSKEKRAFFPFILATPLFFILGASFVYYMVIPLAWEFFLSFEQSAGNGILPMQLEPKVDEYLSLIMRLIIAFGICFELPVLIVLLTKVGLTNSKGLKNKRKYAVLIAFVVAAVITPPDVISQILLAVPIIVLYEISIWCSKIIEED
ncbi:twin-arginine translocase subunit TatC [Rhodospirillaceae bacterium]|nr:twin-arginine translocase subunit TatC [Rhodospirillaceae bacterium]MDC0999483.1 twin-arginine translocase subunit TatC [Alphaproteobacteria bacterium]MDC1442194.1 twin-arginine translocase subunit TatC [Rhodospirillaceae bacterium]